ncbi:MAG: HEAT repeat domain-containing protein [Gemmatimonadaceae bacterium]|nr:HEAT repeat domain-containing protein [Gemmatimonadaceae bacterium]
MSSDDGKEYVLALSRLIQSVSNAMHTASARDAHVRDVESRSRRRALALELDGDVLRIGLEETLTFETPGVEALLSALLGHGVARLVIRQLTPARDLLEMARLLAATPRNANEGRAIETRALDSRLWNIEFIGAFELDDEHITANLPPELLISLRDGAEYVHAESALAKLATRGEQALEGGDSRTIAAVLVTIWSFERSTQHDALRHTAELALKRLISPMALKLTAQVIPSARRRERLLGVLSHAGDEGAEALFAHLCESQDMFERRAYFDALIWLRCGVSMLMQALDSEQWYVARNAAELLGEMRIDGVESSLAILLESDDERRRVAASSALARLRTPDALAALNTVINDPSDAVRYFASTALLARIEGANARQLGVALDADGDLEMKLQIVAALGKLGTPDAVQKLIKTLMSPQAVSAAANLDSEFRCASLEAVATARGSAAMPLISPFRRDKDPRVAETATRLYTRLARGPRVMLTFSA